MARDPLDISALTGEVLDVPARGNTKRTPAMGLRSWK
jgi:hypothetical protein